MITIKRDGKVLVPENDTFIGYEGDNLNAEKEFFVEGITDPNLVYRMYLLFDDESSCYFLLDSEVVEGGTRLLWNVRNEQIYKGGIVKMQIKASNAGGLVFHSDTTSLLVQTSIEFAEVYRDKDNSEYLQHQRYLDALIETANGVYEGIQSVSFDEAPTENSEKGVKSGGVYSALESKLDFGLVQSSNGAPVELADLNAYSFEKYKLYYVLFAGSVLYNGSYPSRVIFFQPTDTNQVAVDINGKVYSRYYGTGGWSAFSESTAVLGSRISAMEATVGTANAALEAVLNGA